jgi:hypothetical protein
MWKALPPIKRVALPIALIVIGIALLEGCIYIPTFNMAVGGKDATKSVGPAGSKKHLQPGMSTRQNVQRILGKPFFASTDGRYLVYSWKKQKGFLFYPLCFMAAPEDDAFAMTIEFGGDGVMKGFDIEKGYQQHYLFDLPHSRKFVPYHVTLYQTELNLQDHPKELERFRAATRAATQRTTRPTR